MRQPMLSALVDQVTEIYEMSVLFRGEHKVARNAGLAAGIIAAAFTQSAIAQENSSPSESPRPENVQATNAEKCGGVTWENFRERYRRRKP